jgi:4-hydroxythreonine-4-phosphate dehydrogenase
MRTSSPLALTMGDPAGIGLEIALKAWHARTAASFALIAPLALVKQRARELRFHTPVCGIADFSDAAAVFETALPVFDAPFTELTLPPVNLGHPDPQQAPLIQASLDVGIDAVLSGAARALVTNPIAKNVLPRPFTGHTEYLAYRCNPEHPPHPVMLLWSERLAVVPVTLHIPLEKVAAALTAETLETTIKIVHTAYQTQFSFQNPRIAVTGLNPHAGEGGIMGEEETRIIVPVLAKLQHEGLNVTGPYPADTLFHDGARATYDVVVAMYHDQALIPFKTLSFDDGVNMTLGLPFVRTSPDHGTAYGIACDGIASATSLIAALRLAYRLA